MAFDLMALRNKLLSRVRFCTEIDHKCSYWVSVVDSDVAMNIFITHPSPYSGQHKMQVLQNVEEKGRHTFRGQHCSPQFCPKIITGKLMPLINFLRVIFLNFRLPKRIGAECEQACAETIRVVGDLFAWGGTKCRDGAARR
jgi:hypothetical protein